MSKRTSEDITNAIEILDPNSLDGGDDEEEVIEGSESDSAAAPAVGGDDFMHTDDFRRLFVEFIMVDTLVAMRWLDKKWHKVVEKKLIELEEDEPFGEIIVHGGNDISLDKARSTARKERIKQVSSVVFLLNITKVGNFACFYASNLVIVDIPEGITSIGNNSFNSCSSLKEIKFPKSLTNIGVNSFYRCSSLEEVDLLHTHVQTFGDCAFFECTRLREMTFPDSLQTFGRNAYVFSRCSKLVPSDIDVSSLLKDVTPEVVAYLRSIQ
ncbi:hypothetical protein TrVE_jg8142 [Triparma verrucosa]|uniref:Uncharacterized protein n=1 Tax=Triparma verrucosa TaxID=1606542 RepID=A0A9W7BZQ4_9STRA|nr:hypothetical protein TrVE_jg8142 [Triparma verrucosa]